MIGEIAPRIASDALSEDVGGRLVVPGFVDSHIHLDKSCLLDRCAIEQGTLQEAISKVAAAKRGFTEEDVYARATRTLEKAILQGTTAMRTHVEVDARVGLTSFNAIRKLAADYAWAIDLKLCVFPQEGLINDPGTEEMLVRACEAGADLIGGCPYADSDRAGHIDRIFDSRAATISTSTSISISISIPPGTTWRRFAGRPSKQVWRPGRDRPCHKTVGDAA